MVGPASPLLEQRLLGGLAGERRQRYRRPWLLMAHALLAALKVCVWV